MKLNTIRRILVGVLGGLVILSAVGCGQGQQNTKKDKRNSSNETVKITLWADEVAAPVIREQLEEFKELHKDEANLDFTVNIEGAHSCKATVLSNPEGAADIYSFADDQMEDLYQNGALMEITENTEALIAAVGGRDSTAYHTVNREGRIYAYPETATNGYFLYYNKKYFTEEDVQSLDRILEVCQMNDKKFTMDFSSGWYIYSFFKGAGLDIYTNEEGNANFCNWNASDTEITGVDVANAMLDISGSGSFVAYGDEGFVSSITSGEAIAGINGAWNVDKVEAAWGEEYAATKLPTYTVKDQQRQMCSFLGYKLMGINANTKYPEWCMQIAEYLTGEEKILERCLKIEECPANLKAASTDKIQANPVVKALALQAPYGSRQNLMEPYWRASSKLGITLAAGNLENKDLQQLLDDTQKEIVAPVK